MIEEIIAEDILTEKLNSETGSISEEDLKNKLTNQYGTIQYEDENKIDILTYDYIEDIPYRDRYTITIDKDILLYQQNINDMPLVSSDGVDVNANDNGNPQVKFQGKKLFSVVDGVDFIGNLSHGKSQLGVSAEAVPFTVKGYGYLVVTVDSAHATDSAADLNVRYDDATAETRYMNGVAANHRVVFKIPNNATTASLSYTRSMYVNVIEIVVF